MKVSREQAALNRERIVDVAARLFREKGYDGIGVADLMKSAGLTHGGFYGHFASKEDLMIEACQHALNKSLEGWRAKVASDPQRALPAIIENYLTTRHRDQPGGGCPAVAHGRRCGAHVARCASRVYTSHAAAVRLAARLAARRRAGRTAPAGDRHVCGHGGRHGAGPFRR